MNSMRLDYFREKHVLLGQIRQTLSDVLAHRHQIISYIDNDND